MRIRVISGSHAVSKTLEAIVLAAGHTCETTPAAAELVIYDAVHPLASATAFDVPVVHLVLHAASAENELTCPLRAAQLMRSIDSLTPCAMIPLSHGWQLDGAGRTLVHATSAHATLTEKECSLLMALASIKPRMIHRDALLADIWGVAPDIDTHTLETHIYRLRLKLGQLDPIPADIITEDGTYRLA